jgi:glycosyltransferase involved in cell wall biosynthesis
MASGTPPIGSTAGGIQDVIIDGVNGLLFRKGDWEDLASKLLMLITDKNLRDKLATNARKHTEKYYGWSSIASSLSMVYKGLMR